MQGLMMMIKEESVGNFGNHKAVSEGKAQLNSLSEATVTVKCTVLLWPAFHKSSQIA